MNTPEYEMHLPAETTPLGEPLRDFIPGMPAIPEGWSLRFDPRTEWRPRDKEHRVFGFVQKNFSNTVLDLNQLPPDVTVLAVPVLYVDDAKGEFLGDVRFEPRLFKDGTEPSELMATASQYWLINRPKAAMLYEAGDLHGAMNAAKLGSSNIHHNVFLKARSQLETEAAFQAFITLFKHYSFNEELWRLERWMDEFLPFDLEEHPQMARFRELLSAQVKHLRGDSGRIEAQATVDWYAKGSPVAGIDKTYVQVSGFSMPTRLSWVVEQCLKEKFTKVAEYGSVEGVNLFHLVKNTPEIQWHGFEVNDEAVERGRALAKETETPIILNRMDDFGDRESGNDEFDAVMLFEVLEHNPPEGGEVLVRNCLRVLRPGGVLYITTPSGNWSGHDEHTRDLQLRKDHIYAFTPNRMKRFLERAIRDPYRPEHECAVESCEYVENTHIKDANGWVFARVRRVK